MGKVIVLVPAYRCEEMIKDTLRSLQEQGQALSRVAEVIVADDGSRDRTAEVVRSLWKSATPLRILERTFNYGEYASVNNAVEQFPADAEWFLMMHADNIAKPGWLQTFLDRIPHVADNVATICSSYDAFDETGKVTPGEDKPGAPIVTIPGTREEVAGTLLRGCWWHISSSVVRVKAFREVGGLPKIMQLTGDWDFMLRLQAAGWTIEYIPKTLMLYRNNPAGSSSITFRQHSDVREMLLVVGRFYGALSGKQLFKLHATYFNFLLRRLARALLRMDAVRCFWIAPALGYTFASYWTCVLTPPPSQGR